jgi:hypothetical protein
LGLLLLINKRGRWGLWLLLLLLMILIESILLLLIELLLIQLLLTFTHHHLLDTIARASNATLTSRTALAATTGLRFLAVTFCV